MKTFKTPKSVIVEINAKIAYAIFLVVVAYFIWPTSMKWYGFGLLSIIAGMAGAALAFNALRQIGEIREFEDDQKEFLAQGKEVKSSTLLAEDFLTEKGVIKNAN